MIEMMADRGNDQEPADPGLAGRFFSRRSERAERVCALAFRVREGIDRINPFIQESTAAVCPSCKNVCCLDKHGRHNREDLVYLAALGITPPVSETGRKETDPCSFLTAGGCRLDRTIRPSGCTWYFCDALYDHMEKKAGYENFDAALQEVAELWMEMTGEFRKLNNR